MGAIAGYRVDEQIHDGGVTVVLRATRVADGVPVIIKAIKQEYPPPRLVASFRKEFEVCRRLHAAGLKGVARPLAFAGDGRDVAMVLEALPGESLQALLDRRTLTPTEATRIGRRLTEIVGAIHAQGIIHKDVKPANVIVDVASGMLWVIDFGISTTLEAEEASSRTLEGSLPYLSPEQTGRMNRPVDYRSDYYALGITLYQMLCGRVPFAVEDPLEMVHAHLAVRPQAPHLVNHAVPTALSAVVMRLLAKTAEERYQSAQGILADLDLILAGLESGGLPGDFVAGRRDVPDRFQISRKLYGREREVEELLATFARVESGSSELLLVGGYSGIGKSALIHEVHPAIVRTRGYFIAGKFDQFKRNIPYASIIEAFSDLVAQLLTEPEARIASWRAAILSALGPAVAVAIDVLPTLALIVGEQPAVPELSGEAAQNRLNRVFLAFVRVFATAEHPLVLFVDDLQWADRPTLNLLRIFVTDSEVRHLLVIGCYRDNEVDASHPLTLTLDAVRLQRAGQAMAPVLALQLGGLSVQTLAELISDSVHSTPTIAASLAELVHRKTHGNPFFVNQFLRVLHQDKLLRFSHGHWTWDLEEIQGRDITDNVVALMTGELHKLPDAAQETLGLAAAIGASFELSALAAAAGMSAGAAADNLWDALGKGYVIPLDENYRLVGLTTGETGVQEEPRLALEQAEFNPRYRFLHDRVQQAAYSLIPESERSATHLRIGRAMLVGASAEALDDHLFSIVDQLAHGLGLVTAPAERLDLAAHFARAGSKARLASAHEPAIRYFKAAEELLGDALWTTQYTLGQPVVFQRSASEYIVGNFEGAERLFDLLVERSRTDLEKAQVYRVKLNLYQSRGLFLETVDIAYRGLAHLGVHLPKNPTQLTFLKALVKFKLRMRGKTEEDLKGLPVCTDPVVVTAIDIMNDFSGPAFFVDINMYLVVVLTMCGLSLEHGNAAESAYCWTLYGMMNGPIMGNVPHGMELGRVGESIDARHNKATLIPKVALSLGGLVYQWGQHPRLSIPYFEKGFQAALESGDPTHAGYCANFMVCMFSVVGEPLDELEARTSRFLDFARKNQIEVQSEIQVVERQFARSLRGRTRGAATWDDDAGFDEPKWLLAARGFQSRQPLHNYLIEKQASLYLLGLPLDALRHGDESATMLDVSLGIPIFSNHHLFYGLAAARVVDLGGPERGRARKILRAMIGQHRKWAKHNAHGFQHKLLLLEAEDARLRGRAARADELYDRAIAQAATQGFIHHEAVANELAGRHALARGREKVAAMFLREARHGYGRWGAEAVVARLDQEFPALSFDGATGVMPTLTIAGTASTSSGRSQTRSGGVGGLLDLQTILRASQVISGEIVLEKLLRRLMTLVLENAGARRAVLLLKKGEKLVVEAEQEVGQDEARVLASGAAETREDLALGVLNYVARTKEAVVLDDVAGPSSFAKDPYVAAQRTRSLLCAPILKGGTLTGLIYLENDLATGAFTPERLELLRLLSAQIAISIENAALYQRAEAQANAFARFVPTEFLTHLGRASVAEIRLGDAVQRDMTVLFSDIRSFTALSENMTPRQNMAFLNEYLRRVGPVMREHGGFIDKYIGDAVMALFPNTVDAAVQAAIAMHEQVRALNVVRRGDGEEPIRIGVGLHHGTLMLGTIGETERMDSTVISDAVNTASRLEELTKAYGAPILISGPTLALCSDPGSFRTRWLGDVRPRGRASTVALHEIYEALEPAARELRDRTKAPMEQAIRHAIAREWRDAQRLFTEVLSVDVDDQAARAFLERADAQAQTPTLRDTETIAALDAPPV